MVYVAVRCQAGWLAIVATVQQIPNPYTVVQVQFFGEAHPHGELYET